MERTVLRLLSAARRKVGRDACAEAPYQVCILLKMCLVVTHRMLLCPCWLTVHLMLAQAFPLQQPAFEWADSQVNASELRWDRGSWCRAHLSMQLPTPIRSVDACRVFSVEKGPEGKRSFIVTTYAKFWERYRNMLPQHRHYYEIIRERRPCHLYFGERHVAAAFSRDAVCTGAGWLTCISGGHEQTWSSQWRTMPAWTGMRLCRPPCDSVPLH